MARTIVITSGKGGVGKTSICVNLGHALASLNLKVLLIDIDLGLNNLDVVMGMENQVVFDLIDVLEGKCRVKQALLQDFYNSNLYVFPSNHTNPNILVEAKSIKKILEEVELFFDYILIDSPAGIESGFYRALEISNEAIVVTTPHISAIRDADKIVGCLKSFGFDNINLVINRVRGDLILGGEMIDLTVIEKYLNINLIGSVPEEDTFSEQLLVGGAIKNGDIKDCFSLIAKNLHNGENNVFDCTKKYRGFWGNIKRNLRKIV